MTAKNAKIEMMQAHEAMAKVLDAKFATLPEWIAFRAIDRALLALDEADASRPESSSNTRVLTAAILPERFAPRAYYSGPPGAGFPSYVALTAQALGETKQPITSNELVYYIKSVRALGDDLEKAKVNITSSVSKDKRFASVPWANGRAWWWADQPIPAMKNEMAKLLE
jgi:hypothetical protein